MTTIKRYASFAAGVTAICVAFGVFVKLSINDDRKITQYSVTASADNNASVVYMTEDISPEGLVKIYEKMNFDDTGKTAVKISTGESSRSNNLSPDLIKDLVQTVDGTLVECNTAYGGSRSTTSSHKQQIEQRGYLEIADVDLLDEDGDMAIPTNINGAHLENDFVGAHIVNYDNLICLSHFKGHQIAGYGGAIKNMSIGFGSFKGKNLIHTTGNSETRWTAGGTQDGFLESMGEATNAVINQFGGRVVYINVMNNLSIDCDCNGYPATPTIHDMGILASYDPVALDKACLDLIYNHVAEEGENTQTFINRVQGRNGLHTLEYAEQIGVGSQTYQLMNIDNEPEVIETPKPTDAPTVTMSYENGTLTIENLTGDATLIHASYTSNNILKKVEFLEAQTQEIKAVNGDKFMLWNSIGNMKPLCETITVTDGEEPSDILVAYFTAAENGEVDAISEATRVVVDEKETGAAKAIANMIADKTGADVFSIQTVKKYPTVYNDLADDALAEKNANEHPKLKTHIPNLDDYNTVFVVFPAWWYTMPMPMFSFFDEYDFSGKRIIPAVTHEGSGLAGSPATIKGLEPDAEVETNGFNVRFENTPSAKTNVESWVESILNK